MGNHAPPPLSFTTPRKGKKMLTNLSPVPYRVSAKSQSCEAERLHFLAESLESAVKCVVAAMIGSVLFTAICVFLLGGF